MYLDSCLQIVVPVINWYFNPSGSTFTQSTVEIYPRKCDEMPHLSLKNKELDYIKYWHIIPLVSVNSYGYGNRLHNIGIYGRLPCFYDDSRDFRQSVLSVFHQGTIRQKANAKVATSLVVRQVLLKFLL